MSATQGFFVGSDSSARLSCRLGVGLIDDGTTPSAVACSAPTARYLTDSTCLVDSSVTARIWRKVSVSTVAGSATGPVERKAMKRSGRVSSAPAAADLAFTQPGHAGGGEVGVVDTDGDRLQRNSGVIGDRA